MNQLEPDSVELRACEGCGHWWHSPIPDQTVLDEMYRTASPFVVSSGAKESYHNKTAPDAFQQHVLQCAGETSGNYLEIGVGGGSLLRRFRKMNFACYGVDPGQWVDDDSIVSSIDNLPRDLRCDVFVLQDVLEHLFDPVALMRLLGKMGRTGAVLFCSFPCKDSRPARVSRGKWAMVRPYGHLHYFSFESAAKMFSLAGMEVRDMRLARTTPISTTILSLDIRGLLYEMVKGGKDQIYAEAVVQ